MEYIVGQQVMVHINGGRQANKFGCNGDMCQIQIDGRQIRMKALCNHPKSNLGSCPFSIPAAFLIGQESRLGERCRR